MNPEWLKFPKLHLVALPLISGCALLVSLMFGFGEGGIAVGSLNFLQLAIFYLALVVFCVSALSQIVVIPLAVRRLLLLNEPERMAAFGEIIVGVGQLAIVVFVLGSFGPGEIL
ncbi:MAG: hypothetical protein IPK27_19940 [Rhodanobacteraceae bacterium]|nr:hypothetical protein [Rhodanobacteraceae bacterium]